MEGAKRLSSGGDVRCQDHWRGAVMEGAREIVVKVPRSLSLYSRPSSGGLWTKQVWGENP